MQENVDPLKGDVSQARKEVESWQLEDVLEDAFRSEYLLRQSEKEFSSENVAFLMGTRDLLEMPESDAQGRRDMAQQLCREHVTVGSMLEVNLPPKVRGDLLQWFNDKKDSPVPTPIWREAFVTCMRTVKFDVFPRFRSEAVAEECYLLHPRRCLLVAKCLQAFAGEGSSVELTPLQRTALDYFEQASKYAMNYTSLASGWPSDPTVENARTVFINYHKHWTDFGVDAKVQSDIKKRLPEAPPGLFRPTLVPCLNTVAERYIEWLDSKPGRDFCSSHVGVTRSLPVKPKKADLNLETTESYLEGW